LDLLNTSLAFRSLLSGNYKECERKACEMKTFHVVEEKMKTMIENTAHTSGV
jgi:hypothetical protein